MELTQRDIDRFFGQVAKRKPNECWPWTGYCDEDGYGVVWMGNAMRKTHQMALHFADKVRPDVFALALHSCDNRPCCNPSHLRWGTPAQNMEDRAGRTFMKNGKQYRFLSEDEAVHVIESDKTTYELASELGVTHSALVNIRSGKSWKTGRCIAAREAKKSLQLYR